MILISVYVASVSYTEIGQVISLEIRTMNSIIIWANIDSLSKRTFKD